MSKRYGFEFHCKHNLNKKGQKAVIPKEKTKKDMLNFCIKNCSDRFEKNVFCGFESQCEYNLNKKGQKAVKPLSQKRRPKKEL